MHNLYCKMKYEKRKSLEQIKGSLKVGDLVFVKRQMYFSQPIGTPLRVLRTFGNTLETICLDGFGQRRYHVSELGPT